MPMLKRKSINYVIYDSMQLSSECTSDMNDDSYCNLATYVILWKIVPLKVNNPSHSFTCGTLFRF